MAQVKKSKKASGSASSVRKEAKKALAVAEESVKLARKAVTRSSAKLRREAQALTLFGATFAIDFIAVDERGHSARRDWRSVLAMEPPDVFVGFGARILAPAPGTVVAAVDGELDPAAALLERCSTSSTSAREKVTHVPPGRRAQCTERPSLLGTSP